MTQILGIKGDSISSGTYVTGANTFWGKACTRFGWTAQNNAQSGAMAMDQSYLIETVGPSQVNVTFLSQNDTEVYGNDSVKLGAFIDYYRALIVMMAGNNFISARSGMTKSSGWTNLTTPGNNFCAYTDTLNATASAPFYGTAVYVTAIEFGAAGSESVFEVEVDGTVVGTVTLGGANIGASALGRAYSDACFRFGGFTNGPHTVLIRNKSSTKRLHLSGIMGSESAVRNSVFVGDVIKKSSYLGTDSAANGDAYSLALGNMIDELYQDGLNVYLIPWRAGFNPATHLQDRLHPNQAGHDYMAGIFIDTVVNSLLRSEDCEECEECPDCPDCPDQPDGVINIPVTNLKLTASGGVLVSAEVT